MIGEDNFLSTILENIPYIGKINGNKNHTSRVCLTATEQDPDSISQVLFSEMPLDFCRKLWNQYFPREPTFLTRHNPNPSGLIVK